MFVGLFFRLGMLLYKTAMKPGYYLHLSIRNSRLGEGEGRGLSSIHRPRSVSFSSLPQHTLRKLGDTAILLPRHRPRVREATRETIFKEESKTPLLPAVWVQEVPGKGEFSATGFLEY